MNDRALSGGDLLDEIALCLARVRDHIYRANVGAMLLEAGGEKIRETAESAGFGPKALARMHGGP